MNVKKRSYEGGLWKVCFLREIKKILSRFYSARGEGQTMKYIFSEFSEYVAGEIVLIK